MKGRVLINKRVGWAFSKIHQVLRRVCLIYIYKRGGGGRKSDPVYNLLYIYRLLHVGCNICLCRKIFFGAHCFVAELWELRAKMCFVAELWELCAEMCVHGDIIIIFPHISKPNKMHLVPSIYDFPILRVSSGLWAYKRPTSAQLISTKFLPQLFSLKTFLKEEVHLNTFQQLTLMQN